MGIIRKTIFAGALGGAGFVGYLGYSTTILSPLSRDDPIWKSKSYKKLNTQGNGVTQDICVKRIPLSKIKPELLQKEGDLVQEFCRGVWSGWGYRFQRAYLARKYQGPETASQLWTVDELAQSTYPVGAKLTDHFEVLERTSTEVVVRAGDSPRNAGPRASDGLFVISAVIDKERNEAVLGLKSCFFNGVDKTQGVQGPMPGWIEELHQWYSRIWMVTGAARITR